MVKLTDGMLQRALGDPLVIANESEVGKVAALVAAGKRAAIAEASDTVRSATHVDHPRSYWNKLLEGLLAAPQRPRGSGSVRPGEKRGRLTDEEPAKRCTDDRCDGKLIETPDGFIQCPVCVAVRS